MAVGVLRHSRADAVLATLAVAHGALLLTGPPAPVIALGLWWNANTIAHNFIHLPFFRARLANAAFSAYLSVVLGLPQTLWRDRHLSHHACPEQAVRPSTRSGRTARRRAGRTWRLRWSAQLGVESLLVAALWVFIVSRGAAFAAPWIAGWAGGLVLCALHGRYEHVRGTVSHYSALYNFAFFNDGYHVEHHRRPAEHWTRLPRHADWTAPRSAWPAVLRWLEPLNLETLERLVLRSALLQRFVLDCHARAFRKLLAGLPPLRRITIVGGGLFPRTALVLRRLAPDAELTIVDHSRANLQRARAYLDLSRQSGGAATADLSGIRLIEASYTPELCSGADLLVVPLSFAGDRRVLYDDPAAPALAVHDWIWRHRGQGFIVSLLLLKRLNLVMRGRPALNQV